MPVTTAKQVGDRCTKCGRTDVEFYRQCSQCKACSIAKAVEYHNRRYSTDADWKQRKQAYSARRRKERDFDTCECGQPKFKKSKRCKACFETPAPHCSKCGRSRDERFHSNVCYDCTRLHSNVTRREAQASGRYQKTQRKRLLKQNYDLTIDEFEAMLSAQGGVCAVCKTDKWKGAANAPCVDHDHDMGGVRDAVRGLLCSKCNWAIGALGDSLAGVMRAVDYLREYERRRLRSA